MMCLFKPNTYDPKDWQCPKPSCRTVNFKKRLTCVSCGARKPDGSQRPLEDWRDGEKHVQGPWDCPDCRTKNEAGAYYCAQCKRPSDDMAKMLEEEKKMRSMDEGRGGGLFDRQDPNDKKDWDSDGEEFDEFGRRKKKKGAAKGAPAASAVAAKSEDRGPGASSAAGSKAKTAADKHKAALERLRNKHAPGGGGGRDGGRRDRSRSRSGSRRRR
mmetsp:Transcript_9400/g.24336  ORF Transcript_9400/g.24336 Transcript_9400/m.24336 type:complete len:214 (+) Transcript_9400:204-845(+)